jgi:hypothetical protein
MQKNAHIRSMGAALMRALGVVASVQPIENGEDPVPGDTLKISGDSQSRYR